MTLQKDVIDLPPTGGVDQGKSKYLPVPFHQVQNFGYDKFGALQKRSGMVAMSDATADGLPFAGPVGGVVASSSGELCALGERSEDNALAPGEVGPFLWSWSPSAARWAPKSSVPGTSVRRLPGVRGERDLDEQTPQVARIGQIEATVWRVGTSCFYRLIDRASGAVLVDYDFLTSGLGGVPGQFFLFACGGLFTVVSMRTATQLRRTTLDPVTLAVSTSDVGAPYATSVTALDAIPTVAGKFAVAALCGAGNNVVVRRVNNATATVDATATEVGRSGQLAVSLGFRGGYGFLLLAWDDRTDIRAKHYVESTLVTALTDWQVEPVATFTVLYGIAAQFDAQNRSFVLMSGKTTTNLDGVSLRAFDAFGAALFATRRIRWVTPQCKPFELGGALYVVVASARDTFAPFRPGRSYGYALLNLSRHTDQIGTNYPVGLEGVFAPLDGYGLAVWPAGYLHSWIGVVDGAAPVPICVFGGASEVTAKNPRIWVDVIELRADTTRPALWCAADGGRLLHLSGALVTQYDGQAAVEPAYLEPPQLFGSITATHGAVGLIAAASPNVYSYLLIWEWIDARGNVHRSRLSEPFSFDLTSGGGPRATLQFNVQTSALMRRGLQSDGRDARPRLAVYRTLANGSVYYRCAWNGEVNDPGVATISYTDSEDDTALLAAARGQIYTTGGVLENETPPAARHVQTSGGRVWLTSAEAPEVWASKELIEGEPPSWNAALRIGVEDVGELVATAWLDGLLVMLGKERIAVLDASAGPGDTGAPGWPRPQLIQTSGGCVSERSVVSFKDGVFFRAADTFKLLTRGREILDIGEAVRDLTDQFPDVLDAVLDTARERVLFLVASGGESRVLSYDYRHTGADGVGSWTWWAFQEDVWPSRLAIWNGTVVASIERAVLREGQGLTPGWDSPDATAPDWVPGLIETPWIFLAALGGYQRAWRLVLEMEQLGAHGLIVDVYVDGNDTVPVQTETWTVAQIQALQGLPRERIVMGLAVQKCSSLKVRIRDTEALVTTPERVTGFRYHRLGIEIGRKRGTDKAEKANTR